jgi:hypothetical protein
MNAATLLLAVALIPAQCGAPSGRSVGGDNNPLTGECTIEFEETVGGVHHRYPYLANADLRLVFGKVILTCEGHRPQTHHATAFLETRRLGAGAEWRSRYDISSADVPSPKVTLFLKASCDRGTVAYWRVHVNITGSISPS